jgi:hypothetical protein
VSHNLHLASVRKALQPRREPYRAAPIARGKYIGLRKIDAERASWIATARDAEARFERTVYKVDFGRIARETAHASPKGLARRARHPEGVGQSHAHRAEFNE